MENKENYNGITPEFSYMLQQRIEQPLRYLEDKATPNDQIRRNLRKPLNTLHQPQVIKARTTTTTHSPNGMLIKVYIVKLIGVIMLLPSGYFDEPSISIIVLWVKSQ